MQLMFWQYTAQYEMQRITQQLYTTEEEKKQMKEEETAEREEKGKPKWMKPEAASLVYVACGYKGY